MDGHLWSRYSILAVEASSRRETRSCQYHLLSWFSSLPNWQSKLNRQENTHRNTQKDAQKHTHQDCLYGPVALIIFHERWIDLPLCDWSHNHHTKLPGDESRRVERWGKHFTLVRPRVPHYDWMTRATSNVKLSHNNSPLTNSHSNISQKSTNSRFLSFVSLFLD